MIGSIRQWVLLCIVGLSSACTTVSAATYFWEVIGSDGVGVDFQSGPNVDEIKEYVVNDKWTDRKWGGRIIISCLNSGWSAFVTGFRVWQDTSGFKFGNADRAGACGHPTKDAALRAAVRSCMTKPICRAATTGKGYQFGYVVWFDDGKNIPKEKNYWSCSFESVSSEKEECSVASIIGYTRDAYWNTRTPFDLREFISTYSR